MTIVVETGSGSATGETYISVTDADTYHSDRGNSSWATLTTAVKEQSLRKATEYMLQIYRMRWKGVRNTATQALDWPRSYVYLEPVVTGANQEFPNLVASNIVPTEVKRACAELALKSSTATLYEDLTQGVKREVVGPIEVEYSEYSPQAKRYVSIDAMLNPYMASAQGAIQAIRA